MHVIIRATVLSCAFTFATAAGGVKLDKKPTAEPAASKASCLCVDEWVVLLANGRSGSTTIVDMLNEVPGVYFAGERVSRNKDDFIDALFHYYETATYKNLRGGPFQTHARVEEEVVLCEIQHAVKAALGPIPPNTRLIGFKTLHAAISRQRLEWLRRVFPCARYIHNYRLDVHAEFSSKPMFAKQGIEEHDLQLRNDLLSNSKYKHFDLPLETFSVSRFNELLRFVGDEDCAYTRVKRSNNHNFKSDKRGTAIECTLRKNTTSSSSAAASWASGAPSSRIYKIYLKTFTQPVATLLGCFQDRWNTTPFSENGKLPGLHGYIPEDLGEYYLYQQIVDSGWRTSKLSEADVVILDTFPVLSHAVGNCRGVEHDHRQQEVLQWLNRREMTARIAFICASWTCKSALRNEQLWRVLQERKARLLINELVPRWVRPPYDVKAHGIVVPYSAHHEIRRNRYPKFVDFAFIGNRRDHGRFKDRVRRALVQLESEKGVMIKWAYPSRNHTTPLYAEIMMHAKWCFCPRGDTSSSRRLFDAMIAGCLPVIISDKIDLPFPDVVPYAEFAITVSEDEWSRDPRLTVRRLRKISKKEISSRQNNMERYVQMLDWRDGTEMLSQIVLALKNNRVVGKHSKLDGNVVAERSAFDGNVVAERFKPDGNASCGAYAGPKFVAATNDASTVRVVNAGLGTTATHAVHEIACSLGMASCHFRLCCHAPPAAVEAHQRLVRWYEERLGRRGAEDEARALLAPVLTSGLEVLVDVPYAILVPELLASLGDEVVVVNTVRDAEEWAARRAAKQGADPVCTCPPYYALLSCGALLETEGAAQARRALAPRYAAWRRFLRERYGARVRDLPARRDASFREKLRELLRRAQARIVAGKHSNSTRASKPDA